MDERFLEAIKRKKVDFVCRMLKKGCSPNCRTRNTCSPALIEALTPGDHKCLMLLLENGASVEIRDKQGMTAVLYACDRGLIDHLTILAEYGADLNAVDNHGMTALMFAAQWDRYDCINFLLNYDPDINKTDNGNMTALMYAAKQGSKDSLINLMDSDADLNMTDSEKGFTALMYALEHRKGECVDLLLERGANINVVGKGKEAGTTALTLAFRLSKDTGEFSFIEKLLRRGADMTLTESDQAYLHEMITRGRKAIVRLMVINGCPPFDKKCWESHFRFSHYQVPISPLCVALLSGFYDVAMFFIVNKFFTNYDVVTLPNDKDISRKLHEQGERSVEALAIVTLISSNPQSLRVLSFVSISEVIHKAAGGTGRCRNIEKVKLPLLIKEELLFKRWSQFCLSSWHELSLDQDQDIEACACSECNGNGLRVKLSPGPALGH